MSFSRDEVVEAVRRAVLTEREECARVLEELGWYDLADRIRYRVPGIISLPEVPRDEYRHSE